MWEVWQRQSHRHQTIVSEPTLLLQLCTLPVLQLRARREPIGFQDLQTEQALHTVSLLTAAHKIYNN